MQNKRHKKKLLLKITCEEFQRLEPDETTDSYILNFVGSLKKDRIDNAGFSIIGPYEKEQFFGDEITLFLE